MAYSAPCKKLLLVVANDTDRLLPAMLQGVKTLGCQRGCICRSYDTEYAAFLAQLVAITVKEGVGKVHEFTN